MPIDAQGMIKSAIFLGLWLSLSNLISGNLVEIQSELQKGLKTSEHQEFLAQLNK